MKRRGKVQTRAMLSNSPADAQPKRERKQCRQVEVIPDVIEMPLRRFETLPIDPRRETVDRNARLRPQKPIDHREELIFQIPANESILYAVT